jgi:hypothetical protein
MRTLLLALLATTAAAQCGTLTITGTGAPGTTLTVAVHGDPNAIAFLVVGDTAGTTSIPLGTTSLDLGIAEPFIPFGIGFTNASGDASQAFTIPNGIPQHTTLGQGLTASFGMPPNFSLSFCTSNVVSFSIG